MASQGLSDAPSCVAASFFKGGSGGRTLEWCTCCANALRDPVFAGFGWGGSHCLASYFVRVHVEMTNHHELFTRDSHVVLTLVRQTVSHRRQMHTSVDLMASLDDVHPDTKMHTRKKRLSEL